jgi:TubC N-terminal docking domain
MNAVDIIRAAEAVGVELYLEGERLRFRSLRSPDPTLLNLITQHKTDIVKLLQQQTLLPRLP